MPAPARRSSAGPACREVGHRLGGAADVVDLDPGHDQPDHRARGGHPVVGVGPPRPPGHRAQRPGPDLQAVGVLGHRAAQGVDLGGQRGDPVGLVAAHVGDAAQPGRPVGERGQRGHHRGQLADLGQVDVDAVQPGRPAHGHARGVEVHLAAHRAQQVEDGRAGLGGVLRPAGDGHRAAGDDRGGQERRRAGQVRLDVQSPARIGPGATRHPSGSASSTCTPASRSMCTVIRCAARGHRRPGVRAPRRPGRSAPRTAAGRRRTARSRTRRARPRRRAARRARAARTAARRPSTSAPSARSASSSGPIGRSRARGSPSNLTGPSASAATGGTNRITVPASPQSTSASPRSPSCPPTVQPLAVGRRPARPARAARRPSARCPGWAARRARRPARRTARPAPAPGWSSTSTREP